jgi:hypothetical protein
VLTDKGKTSARKRELGNAGGIGIAVVTFSILGEEIFKDEKAGIFNPALDEYVITGHGVGYPHVLEVATPAEFKAVFIVPTEDGEIEYVIIGFFTNLNFNIEVGEPITFTYEFRGVRSENDG